MFYLNTIASLFTITLLSNSCKCFSLFVTKATGMQSYVKIGFDSPFRLAERTRRGESQLFNGASGSIYEDDVGLVIQKKLSVAGFVKRIYTKLGMLGINELKLQLNKDGTTLDEILTTEITAQITNLINKEKMQLKSKIGEGKVENSLIPTGISSDAKKRNDNARSDVLSCIDDSVSAGRSRGNKRFTIKLCNSDIRYNNEVDKYLKICGKSGSEGFVKIVDYGKAPNGVNKIIMESGDMDLQQAFDMFLGTTEQKNLEKKRLKAIFKSMAEALAKIHSKNFVWTDLKLENHVLVPTNEDSSYYMQPVKTYFGKANKIGEKPTIFDGTHKVKAIDLESAVKAGSTVLDFSPQVLAPEQFDAISQGQLSTASGNGRNTEYKLDLVEPLIAAKSIDVWCLGVCILQLYLGRAPIVSTTDLRGAVAVMQRYLDGTTDLGLSEVKDGQLQKLLRSMLSLDPKKRPTIQNVLLSLYFFTP